MKFAASGPWVRVFGRVLALLLILAAGTAPSWAQNKKNSWEVFIYFGGFFSNEVPSATQSGEVQTYRVEPSLAFAPWGDPNNLDDVYRPDLGLVGGDQTSAGPNDPNYNYPFNTPALAQVFGNPPCLGDLSRPGGPFDMVPGRAAYADECDDDLEALWKYNASGIVTNGEIQKDDTEFTLGIRTGYNITRHWEVEFDIGFGKQRLDLTQNLVPLLTLSTNDIANPSAQALADFYQFTWANRDYEYLVPPETAAPGSIPTSSRAESPTIRTTTSRSTSRTGHSRARLTSRRRARRSMTSPASSTARCSTRRPSATAAIRSTSTSSRSRPRSTTISTRRPTAASSPISPRGWGSGSAISTVRTMAGTPASSPTVAGSGSS